MTRADEGERTHEFTRLTIVNQKVLVLGAEAENCIGEDLSFVGATKVDVEIDPNIPMYDPTQPPGPRHRHRTPGRSQPPDGHGLSVGPRQPISRPNPSLREYLPT